MQNRTNFSFCLSTKFSNEWISEYDSSKPYHKSQKLTESNESDEITVIINADFVIFPSRFPPKSEEILFWNQKPKWVTVMLATSLCWWLYDGDCFEMLVAESLCWRLSQWIGHQHLKLITNTFGLQHRCNPQMFNRIDRCFRRLKLLKMTCIFSLKHPFVDTSSPLWDLRRQNLHHHNLHLKGS